MKRSKCLFLLKTDTQVYFCLLKVFVLQDSFMDFVQLACELVQPVSATCSTSKYIYNVVLSEHIIKIYLSYIFGKKKRIFIDTKAPQFL